MSDSTSLNYDKPQYSIMLAGTVKTYDYETKKYIPASKLPALSWDDLVKVIIHKDMVMRKKRGLDPQKDGVGIIPSSIKKTIHDKGGRKGYWRLKRGCVETPLLVLDVEDYDMGGDDPESIEKWVRSLLPSTKALIYTSYNHGVPGKWKPNHPRFRIVIPLSRAVSSLEEYPHLFRWSETFFDGAIDDGCKDPSRLSYTYRGKNPDAVKEPFWFELEGSPLDPDALPSSEDGSGDLSVDDMMVARRVEERKREAIRKMRMKEIESGIRDTPSRTQKVAYLKATLSNLISNIQSAGETGRNRAQTHAAWKMGTMLQDPDLYDWQSKAKDALIEASKGVFSKESRRADVPRIINFQFDIGLKATPFDWDSKLSTVKEDTPLEYDIFAIGPNNSVNIGFKGGSKGGSNEQ